MTAPAEQTSGRVPAPIVAAGTLVVLAGVGVLAYAISAMVNDGTAVGVLIYGSLGLLLAAGCGLLALGLRQRRRGAQWTIVILAVLNLIAGVAALSTGGAPGVVRIIAAALAGGLVLIPTSSRDYFTPPSKQ